jgi:exopolyphosphatase/guanosine-5'-triphosphate,3'-diphosphate pyrophosphatase
MADDLRLAACDVGSNAIRLVISRVVGSSSRFLQREASYRVPLRLGVDVFTTGKLSDEKVAGLVEVFKAFRILIGFFAPQKLRACATSALREAENGPAAAERVWAETGIRLEVISGAEEARTLFANHLETGLSPQQDYLYIDVGGGSTELTLLTDGQVKQSESFKIGGVRLLQSRVEASEWERMRSFIDALPRGIRSIEAVGTGGNIGKIYDLVVGTPGGQLSRRRIREVVETLEPMSIEQRMREHGLKPDRADVIVPAGRVYYQVMKWADIKAMVVPKFGVADGLLSQMFEQIFGHPPATNAGKTFADQGESA